MAKQKLTQKQLLTKYFDAPDVFRNRNKIQKGTCRIVKFPGVSYPVVRCSDRKLHATNKRQCRLKSGSSQKRHKGSFTKCR